MPTRPALADISHGVEAWDATIEDNFDLLTDTPLPLAYYATEAALISAGGHPDPAAYQGCAAAVVNTEGTTIYVSDGVTWLPLARRAAAQVDSVAVTVAGIVADFNALLAKLRTDGVIHT